MPALPDVAVSDLPPASGPRLRLQLLGISNTYPPLITGGYGEICADVMETLRRRGHGVTMLVCDQSYAPLPGDDQSHVRRWLAYVLAPWRHPLKGLRAASRNDRATRSVLEQGFDAVLAWHCRGVSKNVLRRCHEQGVPVLYFLHDRWVLYERPGALLLPWARLDRWGARLPREILGSSIARRVELRAPRIDRDGVLCYVSDWLQDEHHRRGFVGRTETKVPCGVRIRPHAQRVAGVSPRRLLFAGRIEPRKGLAVAVEALAACPEDTTLTVVGPVDDQRYEREVVELSRRLGVGHRLDFRGEISRDAVKDLLLTHDILVFPSIGVEAYALGLLEGCAAGILIVTSALGGPQEYLRHEQNALVHEPGDAAGLAAAISRIQQDPALAETLTAGALATAAAHDMNRIVDQVERLLEEQIA